MTRLDTVVIGAGIVGLSVARSLLARRRGSSVLVIDKESSIATQQSSHNSGVIHSGIYYKPGSLKARLCVEGSRLMIQYCKDRGLPLKVDGKLIVALQPSELPLLKELERRGRENGVLEVSFLDSRDIRNYEPNARGLAALHVGVTGVTDYLAVAKQFAQDVQSSGGEIALSAEVKSIRQQANEVHIEATSGRIERAKEVIVCAGVQSDRLSKSDELRIIPFRGSFYDLTNDGNELVRSMIYPVPDPRFPFLGVHFTRHWDDSVSCGPNAVLALARERYDPRAFNWKDAISTLAFSGFWRLVGNYYAEGFNEIVRDFSRKRFFNEAQHYLPDLQEHHLLSGTMGIRAQAINRSGKLIDDFAFVKHGRVTHVVNAPSPAATASISIGEYVVNQTDI